MKIVRAKQPVTTAVTSSLSRLAEDWKIIFTLDDTWYRLTISKGFLFDGASIPSLFWFFLKLTPHGIMDGPSLPHDCGYEVQGVFTLTVNGVLTPAPLTGGATATLEVYSNSPEAKWVLTDKVLTKVDLDRLLQLLCVHFGVNFRSIFVWLGVRAGGWFAWKSDDKSRKYKQLAKKRIYNV